jgi:hypothetical protein
MTLQPDVTRVTSCDVTQEQYDWASVLIWYDYWIKSEICVSGMTTYMYSRYSLPTQPRESLGNKEINDQLQNRHHNN